VAGRFDRRAFLLLAAFAPLALPEPAAARLKMPTRVPPPQARPLGQWRALRPRVEVEAGQTALVELTFRATADVAEPYYNWWPRRLPTAPPPAPPTPTPTVPRGTRITPVPRPAYRPTPIPLGSPQRPFDEPFVEPLMGGLWTPVLIEIPIAANTCPGGYRVTVQMSGGPVDSTDPSHSRRRALFTFLLVVTGNACPRPTPIPHPTRTPRRPTP
jgi:hypothetical protein